MSTVGCVRQATVSRVCRAAAGSSADAGREQPAEILRHGELLARELRGVMPGDRACDLQREQRVALRDRMDPKDHGSTRSAPRRARSILPVASSSRGPTVTRSTRSRPIASASSSRPEGVPAPWRLRRDDAHGFVGQPPEHERHHVRLSTCPAIGRRPARSAWATARRGCARRRAHRARSRADRAPARRRRHAAAPRRELVVAARASRSPPRRRRDRTDRRAPSTTTSPRSRRLESRAPGSPQRPRSRCRPPTGWSSRSLRCHRAPAPSGRPAPPRRTGRSRRVHALARGHGCGLPVPRCPSPRRRSS